MLKDSVYYATYMQPILSRYQGVAVHPEGNNMYRLVCSTEEQVLSLANACMTRTMCSIRHLISTVRCILTQTIPFSQNNGT